jgi:hypothetical protein
MLQIPRILIIIMGFLSICCLTGCTDLMGDEGTILAENLDEIPDDFINLTEEQLERFPHLQQAINLTGEHVGTPSDEWYELKEFFKDSFKYIEYKGEYYYVRLFGMV